MKNYFLVKIYKKIKIYFLIIFFLFEIRNFYLKQEEVLRDKIREKNHDKLVENLRKLRMLSENKTEKIPKPKNKFIIMENKFF